MPILPSEVIRSLSLPPVSTVNVSAAGNLIAVLVSPVWIILSAIDTSLLTVTIPTNSAAPAAVIVPPTPDAPISNPPLAVTIPRESTLVTSSYVRTPPTVTAPVKLPDAAVIAPPTLIPPAPVNP